MSAKVRILDMSVVSSKYQVTLKKSVREAFNIRAGQRVMFVRESSERGERLILQFEG
jgi:looped-hinge helix DNA binding domain, AbrB family